MEIVDVFLDTVDSTNQWAQENLSSLDPNKITCITAKEQTKGRGRFQRTWVSPKGENIYTTFYFRLKKNALHLTSLAQVMTICFAKVLINEGFSPKIKLPNDVLLSCKKVSGVLCETSFKNDNVDVFLGIGINIDTDEKILSQIDPPATSLYKESKKKWTGKEILKKLQDQFSSDFELFKTQGFTPFHSSFENLLAYKGQKVRCFDGKREWTGLCHSITNDGQLNLCLPNKEMKTILSGDVFPAQD